MSRIFISLTVVAVGLLAAAIFLGLNVGEYNEQYQEFVSVTKELRSLQRKRQMDSPEAAAWIDKSAALKDQLQPLRKKAKLHMMVGLLAGLVSLLVNSIAITYFIGTNRWCKEVVGAYHLDTSYIVQTNRLKRLTFPWALLGMLTILVIAALGASSDPGTLSPTTATWVPRHFWAAMLGVSFIAISFMIQVTNISANSELVDKIVDEVRLARIARGLSVDENPA